VKVRLRVEWFVFDGVDDHGRSSASGQRCPFKVLNLTQRSECRSSPTRRTLLHWSDPAERSHACSMSMDPQGGHRRIEPGLTSCQRLRAHIITNRRMITLFLPDSPALCPSTSLSNAIILSRVNHRTPRHCIVDWTPTVVSKHCIRPRCCVQQARTCKRRLHLRTSFHRGDVKSLDRANPLNHSRRRKRRLESLSWLLESGRHTPQP
jgi:hypothetical protein